MDDAKDLNELHLATNEWNNAVIRVTDLEKQVDSAQKSVDKKKEELAIAKAHRDRQDIKIRKLAKAL